MWYEGWCVLESVVCKRETQKSEEYALKPNLEGLRPGKPMNLS